MIDDRAELLRSASATTTTSTSRPSRKSLLLLLLYLRRENSVKQPNRAHVYRTCAS